MSAPVQRCFDLARSIDVHVHSAFGTNEQAVGGVTSGLIAEGQEVEWKARHFGLWLTMRVRITGWRPPGYFQDSMVRGPFQSFTHDHTFEPDGSGTLMTDRITFLSPLHLVGKLLDRLILHRHLQRFVQDRNDRLKAVAESNLWQHYLQSQHQ
jgi:ligand-binding SRPBCC domain-containing protein